MDYMALSAAERQQEYDKVSAEYESWKAKGLKLNMARGKPSKQQLDLVSGILTALTSAEECVDSGVDARNYGELKGLESARKLFADILGCKTSQVFAGGNSSLQLMYDTVSKAYTHGLLHSEKPWCKEESVKWLCPSPGYDRHFKVTESFGFELITIPMTENGPDMDIVENLIKDPSVKGMWNVPKYSNPDGIIYSDETIERIAKMKPAAPDFLLMWDNAYCIHEFDGEFVPFKDILSECEKYGNADMVFEFASTSKVTLPGAGIACFACSEFDGEFVPFKDILSECEKYGNADMVFEFASTSKVTLPGAGIACFACSEANMEYMAKLIGIQAISFDKMNQLRHVKFLQNKEHTLALMKEHAKILKPKFDMVVETLEREIKPLGIASWHTPKGGYFVSVNTAPGLAKRTLALAKEAGVVMTSAGATYPYGHDPLDSNIRVAPSLPPVEELEQAMAVFCCCLKLAALEKSKK